MGMMSAPCTLRVVAVVVHATAGHGLHFVACFCVLGTCDWHLLVEVPPVTSCSRSVALLNCIGFGSLGFRANNCATQRPQLGSMKRSGQSSLANVVGCLIRRN
uniref:Putative secreted protein n=1 Tax=Ixodes ricinus TaxID=34613 RepID=A0A6B0UGY8_IXORI